VTNASAVKAKTANIGAAVSINRVTVDNQAVVGVTGRPRQPDRLAGPQPDRVDAERGDQKHNLSTEATSGAGGGKVGIAGSLAADDRGRTTNAEIHSRRRPRAAGEQAEPS
jgi:hypothetical protein